LKIVFFTFYYPPDLSAGSFRAIALAQALSKRLNNNDELHIITTHPNRYATHRVEAEDIEIDGKTIIHRIDVPRHQGGMFSQIRTFGVFAFSAFRLCRELGPDFIIGTTSRLMTGVLTGWSARWQNCDYFIDLRDIFSETISDLFKRKNQLMGTITKSIFLFLEKRVFNGAVGVNVVSEGFPEYFQTEGIDTSSWSFFSNGVDKEFLNFSYASKGGFQDIKTILYAGNIGSGQGLETVIPAAAKRLGAGYRFLVVGGGGTNSLLVDAIEREGVSNVELLPPVGRVELMEYYQQADILFLHLNDVPAFRRVLPSKIFEYAALGRPIVAGLSGYSAQFIRDYVPYATLFGPGDVDGCVESIQSVEGLIVEGNTVDHFVKKYSRERIMDKMAEHILSIA